MCYGSRWGLGCARWLAGLCRPDWVGNERYRVILRLQAHASISVTTNSRARWSAPRCSMRVRLNDKLRTVPNTRAQCGCLASDPGLSLSAVWLVRFVPPFVLPFALPFSSALQRKRKGHRAIPPPPPRLLCASCIGSSYDSNDETRVPYLQFTISHMSKHDIPI